MDQPLTKELSPYVEDHRHRGPHPNECGGGKRSSSAAEARMIQIGPHGVYGRWHLFSKRGIQRMRGKWWDKWGLRIYRWGNEYRYFLVWGFKRWGPNRDNVLTNLLGLIQMGGREVNRAAALGIRSLGAVNAEALTRKNAAEKMAAAIQPYPPSSGHLVSC